MKNIIFFLALELAIINKFTLLIMILMFSIVKPMWSQVPDVDECDSGYDFTYTRSGCTYHFEADLPGGDPEVLAVTWYLLSGLGNGYSQECQYDEGFDVYMDVCFHGYHTMVMILDFGNDVYCKISKTFYALCDNSLLCDPDPTNTTSSYYQTPAVHIAYKFQACPLMGVNRGWIFMFTPEGAFNCEDAFIYNLYYYNCSNNNACQKDQLEEKFTSCKTITKNTTIIVEAIANSCCLPPDRKWYYIFTPTDDMDGNPSGWTTRDCNYWQCPGDLTDCDPGDDIFYLNSSQPTTLPCLTGGNTENSLKNNNDDFLDQHSSECHSLFLNSEINSLSCKNGFINIYSINGIKLISNPSLNEYHHNIYSQNSYLKLGPGIYIIELIQANDRKIVKKVIRF